MSTPDDPRTRHERLQRLFLEARALEGAAREAFVQEACAEDAELRKELEQLLAHDRPSTGVEEEPDSPLRRELDALRDRAAESGEPPPPEFIGEYRVLRKLGEGGMGTVYEARQEKLQRTVALKVLRPGSFSPQSLRRFEHEGEFLGRLEHPGIARIYDSGRAETAYGLQPYFAMELVEGVPLTEYARSRDLSLRERLELVARVADAIEHAHRHGVIHRDLKPDNILVDAEGQPKILDFGIARASDSDVQMTTLGTDVGQILGTLAYMSPEQATGNPDAIDGRSDVYSLGVLLHELIANRLPYDVSRRTLPEALRIIQEEEPPRLSTSNTQLRGDVETIARTALEKDKTRRYASAGSLAADLRHYLHDEPISARPASRIYTLKKFVRRNRTLVGASLVVFLALTAGLVVSLFFAFGERDARARADRFAEEATASAEKATESAAEATKSAAEAAARLKDREQLSALLDVEALFVRADSPELWPPHPANLGAYELWVREAEALLAKRAEFEASRDRVRARALPLDAEDLANDAWRHPDYETLLNWKRLQKRYEVQLRWILDGEPAAVPDPDSIEGDDPRVLLADAADTLRIRVGRPGQGPGPGTGRDELGLAIALKARELAGPEQRADAELLVAWGYHLLGQNEEAELALEALYSVLDDAPLERRFRLFPVEYFPPAEGLSDLEVAMRQAGPITYPALLLEQRLAELEAKSRQQWAVGVQRRADRAEQKLLDLKAAVEQRQVWRYADGDDVWWSKQFDELTGGLEELDRDLLTEDAVSEKHGWGVRKREAFAEDLRRGFAPGGEYARAWAEFLPAMQADYPGADFAPQMGLVPLGRDGVSGLWEFAHLASGDPPQRDEAGSLVLTDETGIVLVLLRSGEYWMGAQSQDPGVMNYVDIEAKPATETRPETRAAKAVDQSESPPRRVLISSYFLSKYEMTQGQWLRLTGTNPSRDQNEGMLKRMSAEGIGDPAQHPVNMVSWDECNTTCERFGLRLPTSAEWEYAARGGTQTAWWTGDDPLELRLAANLADEFGMQNGTTVLAVESWSDGEAIHARVDRFRPNPFGLYNVHGNLSEWCQDADWPNAMRLRPYLVDPLFVTPREEQDVFLQEGRFTRGGSFADLATLARSAKLMPMTRGAYEEFIGVRPARALDPH